MSVTFAASATEAAEQPPAQAPARRRFSAPDANGDGSEPSPGGRSPAGSAKSLLNERLFRRRDSHVAQVRSSLASTQSLRAIVGAGRSGSRRRSSAFSSAGSIPSLAGSRRRLDSLANGDAAGAAPQDVVLDLGMDAGSEARERMPRRPTEAYHLPALGDGGSLAARLQMRIGSFADESPALTRARGLVVSAPASALAALAAVLGALLPALAPLIGLSDDGVVAVAAACLAVLALETLLACAAVPGYFLHWYLLLDLVALASFASDLSSPTDWHWVPEAGQGVAVAVSASALPALSAATASRLLRLLRLPRAVRFARADGCMRTRLALSACSGRPRASRRYPPGSELADTLAGGAEATCLAAIVLSLALASVVVGINSGAAAASAEAAAMALRAASSADSAASALAALTAAAAAAPLPVLAAAVTVAGGQAVRLPLSSRAGETAPLATAVVRLCCGEGCDPSLLSASQSCHELLLDATPEAEDAAAASAWLIVLTLGLWLVALCLIEGHVWSVCVAPLRRSLAVLETRRIGANENGAPIDGRFSSIDDVGADDDGSAPEKVALVSEAETETLVSAIVAASAAIEANRSAALKEAYIAERLLETMVPEHIAMSLKDLRWWEFAVDDDDAGGPRASDEEIALISANLPPETYEEATVLFVDMAGSTKFASELEPAEVFAVNNLVFSAFDRITAKCGLYKVETIGDAYMAVAGAPHRTPDHALRAARAALEMRSVMPRLAMIHPGCKNIAARFGMASGSVAAGVVGFRNPRWHLFGDTVNVASRMESTGISGQVQIARSTFEQIRDRFTCEPRGLTYVKGHGDLATYILLNAKAALEGVNVNMHSGNVHRRSSGKGAALLAGGDFELNAKWAAVSDARRTVARLEHDYRRMKSERRQDSRRDSADSISGDTLEERASVKGDRTLAMSPQQVATYSPGDFMLLWDSTVGFASDEIPPQDVTAWQRAVAVASNDMLTRQQTEVRSLSRSARKFEALCRFYLHTTLLEQRRADANVDALFRCASEVAMTMVNADRATLYIADHNRGEVWSRAVSGDTAPANGVIRVKMNTGLVGACAARGQVIIVDDAYQDKRFDRRWDELTGFHTVSVMCIPIKKDGSNRTMGVLQVINKHLDWTDMKGELPKGGGRRRAATRALHVERFTRDDASECEQIGEAMARVLARKYYELQVQSWNLEGRSKKRMQTAATAAPHGYAVPANLAAGFESQLERSDSDIANSVLEAAKTKSGSVGSGADGGKGASGGAASNALAVGERGAVDVFDARGGTLLDFTDSDEQAAGAERHEETLARHGGPAAGEAAMVAAGGSKPTAAVLARLDDWDCAELFQCMPIDELAKVAEALFYRAGLVQSLGLSADSLRGFISGVAERYEDNPYHNFGHALCVFHGCFLALTMSRLKRYVSDLEAFALLIAALCHDVGHDGMSNAFHVNTLSPRALRYSDFSVQEMHHCEQMATLALCRGSNYAAGLSPQAQRDVRKLVIALILSTEMGAHMKSVSALSNLESDDFSTPEVKLLLLSATLQAVDVSNPTKSRKVAELWAGKVTEEFLQQVSRENDLGLPVAPHMACLADPVKRLKGEVNFVDFVVMPMWSALVERLPELFFAVDNLRTNRELWINEVELMKGRPSLSNAWTKSLARDKLKDKLAKARSRIAAKGKAKPNA